MVNVVDNYHYRQRYYGSYIFVAYFTFTFHLLSFTVCKFVSSDSNLVSFDIV